MPKYTIKWRFQIEENHEVDADTLKTAIELSEKTFERTSPIEYIAEWEVVGVEERKD